MIDFATILRQYGKEYNLNGKYIEKYIKFIERNLNRNFDNYASFHKHHIIPESWNGPSIKENLIRLPNEYHIVAHWILALTEDRKMCYAFSRLVSNFTDNFKSLHYDTMIKIIRQSKYMFGKANSRPVMNIDTQEIFESAVVAGSRYNIDPKNIYGAIKRYGKANGIRFQYVDIVNKNGLQNEIDKFEARVKPSKKNESVINLTTKQIYKSTLCVSELLGVCEKTVIDSINNHSRCKGDFYQYACNLKDLSNETIKEENARLSEIRQYSTHSENYECRHVVNLDTLKEYKSLRLCCTEIGCTKASLYNNIIDRRKSKGYYYQFKDVIEKSSIEQELELCHLKLKQSKENRKKGILNGKTCRKVQCIETQIIYNSITEAAKDNNDCISNITGAIRRSGISHGLHWKYID